MQQWKTSTEPMPVKSRHSHSGKHHGYDANCAFFQRASERRVLPIVGVCISSSHLHTFSHTFSSSHLLIFTTGSSIWVGHTFSSSHLLIFTSSHLHIFSSSHLLIFTSAHLHIFSSSHLLIFTSAHLHIFTSSHTHIFSFLSLSLSLSLALTSSHTHIFSLSLLFPLSFLSLLSLSLFISLFRPRVVPAGSHETWTLSHEMRFDRQKLR